LRTTTKIRSYIAEKSQLWIDILAVNNEGDVIKIVNNINKPRKSG